MKTIILLLMGTMSLGAMANDLIISSSPEKAEVRITTLQGSSTVKAGLTPFKMSLAEISTTFAAGANMFVVEVAYEGHEVYRIVVPQMIKSDITLELKLQNKAEWNEVKKFDKAVADLFEVQRMIRGQNYEGATKKIDEVEKIYPKLSATKELRASSFYLRNDYKNALDYYQQAYFANTDNLDAYKMMVYLEKSLDVKKAKDDKND